MQPSLESCIENGWRQIGFLHSWDRVIGVERRSLNPCSSLDWRDMGYAAFSSAQMALKQKAEAIAAFKSGSALDSQAVGL
jgi:hypothetical protein